MHRRCAAVLVILGLLAGPFATAGEAGTLKRVKETGTIKIGYRADARPHSYTDVSGHPAGFIVDLCREVVAALRQELRPAEVKPDFIVVTAENRFQAVQSGAIDLLCEPSSVTISRREIVDFSLPTFIDGAGVLAQRGLAIRSFEDFGGKRIGVLSGTTSEQTLRGALRDLGIKATIQAVKDHREGAALAEGGRLDMYFADRSILAVMMAGREAPRGLELGPRYFSYEVYGLALQRGDDAFRLLVDRTLARLYRSGRAEDLIKKAFGTEPDEVLRLLIAVSAVPN